MDVVEEVLNQDR